jgi:methionyl aminopeptidase
MIPLKSEEDLKMLRESGRILAGVLRCVSEAAAPGVETRLLDALAYDLIIEAGATPAFKGYRGFPATICTSINEEIVHGIPSERTIKEGDLLSIDLGVNYAGFFTDAALTLAVGRVSPKASKLINVTRMALAEGIKEALIGNKLFDISHRIQSFVEGNGFSVVRSFVGHGIGVELHEEPEIPNFGPAHEGPALKQGMVLAIEPMVNMGGFDCEVLDNGWTAVTKDRLPSAHFEHTVAVTVEGPLVLTG